MPYMDIADGNKVKRAPMSVIVSKGGAILKPAGTLKGDLLVVLAPDVFVRLPVGADGEVLTADGAQSTGVKWASTPAKFRRHSFIWYIESPAITDDFPARYIHDAATITSVVYVTGAGTTDFNIEKRTKLAPDVAGTNIWTADKTANTTGAESTTFDSASVPAQTWLTMDISAVTGAGPLWVAVVLTTDL